MRTYPGTDLAAPPPAHTLTPAAEQARREMREWAAANPLRLVDGKPRRVAATDDPAADLVTSHVPPWREGRILELKGAPYAFALAATSARRALRILVAGDAVEVRVDGGRIRAWWKAGRTTGAVMDGKRVTLTAAKAAL